MDISALSRSTATSTINRSNNTTAGNRSTSGTPLLQALPPSSGVNLPAKIVDFSSEVGKMFRDNGISVPPEAVLTSDGEGYVRVTGDHPEKAKIEALFKDNPELRNQFAEISANSSLQRAVEGYENYARHYQALAGNPDAQKALVYREIARNQASFNLAIGSTGGQPFFTGLKGISA